jgi:hypothetical protein
MSDSVLRWSGQLKELAIHTRDLLTNWHTLYHSKLSIVDPPTPRPFTDDYMTILRSTEDVASLMSFFFPGYELLIEQQERRMSEAFRSNEWTMVQQGYQNLLALVLVEIADLLNSPLPTVSLTSSVCSPPPGPLTPVRTRGSLDTSQLVDRFSDDDSEDAARQLLSLRPSPRANNLRHLPSEKTRRQRIRYRMPKWCSRLVPDGDEIVPIDGLGLTDQPVHEGMCGLLKQQVQRIWSEEGPDTLLSALIRCDEFNRKTSYKHPEKSAVQKLRGELKTFLDTCTDREYANIAPIDTSLPSRQELIGSVLDNNTAPLSSLMVYVYHAYLGEDAPRIYLIAHDANRDQGPSYRLLVVGRSVAASPDTKCLVLYEHRGIYPSHFEAVGFKKARGNSPLTTCLLYSDPIIRRLEKWRGTNKQVLGGKRKASLLEFEETESDSDRC